MAMLRQGLSGEPVRHLQRKLGIEADGKFGPATGAALKKWQSEHGVAADGIAGPDTFVTMGLWELILLKSGTKGDTVKKLQEKLGIPADGNFGPGTEKAVREYQQKNGLAADGIAGPATLAHMKLFREITPDVVQQSQVPASSAPPGTATQPAPGQRARATPQGAGQPPPAPLETVEVRAASATGGKRSIWDTITGVFK